MICSLIDYNCFLRNASKDINSTNFSYNVSENDQLIYSWAQNLFASICFALAYRLRYFRSFPPPTRAVDILFLRIKV